MERYKKRRSGDRGLISVDRCIMSKRRMLSEYLINSEEDLLQYAAKDTGVNANEMIDGDGGVNQSGKEKIKENLHQMRIQKNLNGIHRALRIIKYRVDGLSKVV